MTEFEAAIADADVAVGADAFVEDGAGLEVAVVGGGAVGVTAAYDLATRGASVTLYERDSIASGASGRAAGICYNAFAGTLDGEIARESIERFRRLSGDDTFPFTECPYVWLARTGDDRGANAIESAVSTMQERGVVAVTMDGAALGERFPAMYTDDVEIAGVAGAAGYTDPTRYTACLGAAASGAGATLETATAVSVRGDPPRVVPDESGQEREFDAVLVAAGAQSGSLLADAGYPIAVKPYRVQAATATGTLEEPTCYDATGSFYVRPHPTGLLAGNGTELTEADSADWDRTSSPGFASDLLDRVARRFPGAAPSVERSWAGLCTATPDRDPLVGAVADGLYVATGFQGEGFMRAPAIGERFATEIVGGEGIDPFDPTRFDGEESFEIREGIAVEEL